MILTMYIDRTKRTYKDKIYIQTLLRESYRTKVDGVSKVKLRTIANLTRLPPQVIVAIEHALKAKRFSEKHVDLNSIQLEQGRSVGSVYLVEQIARRLGIQQALGRSFDAKLALWQIIARVVAQGSRLSAVRLSETCALADVLKIKQGFDENRLYENLAWLSDNQTQIEQKLYAIRVKEKTIKSIFLYDVTSSYLEGQKNHFAKYGYNRDKKKGKKQIVIGLLCDSQGVPVSVEVFHGNRSDTTTLSNQIHKAAEVFGVQKVVFVGDRGMIKSGGIEELKKAGFHYISSLTRGQIQKLVSQGSIQLELFDENICETQVDGERLILRRNPLRAREIKENRKSKYSSIKEFMVTKNTYLEECTRAKTGVAARKVQEKIDKLKIGSWLKVTINQRKLELTIDRSVIEELETLDGCYVLRSDVDITDADSEIVHARYKDLAKVEHAFRTCKSGHLELRPIYVRKKESTRGHVFIVMLSYLIKRELDKCWAGFDVTVQEGIEILGRISEQHMIIEKGISLTKIPEPTGLARKLLDAANVVLPTTIAHNQEMNVHTKTKLKNRR